MRWNGCQRQDQKHRGEGAQYRRGRDCEKSADRVNRHADGCSERKCGKHRHPDPCDDSSCVLGAGKGKSPVHRAGDDKALRYAEHGTAEQQYCDGQPRGADKNERQKVKQPGGDSRQQAGNNRAFGSSPVGVSARPNP